jgi:hypothetical protein
MERLRMVLPRLSSPQAAALTAGGAAGLVGRLAEEAEERLPEILRPRPQARICWCLCWCLQL